MKSLTNWYESNKAKATTLDNSLKRDYEVKFDSYTETQKAWIISKNGRKHILAKSVTKMDLGNNTISVPSWLFLKEFKENEDLAF